jgi:hypothetical protein
MNESSINNHVYRVLPPHTPIRKTSGRMGGMREGV